MKQKIARLLASILAFYNIKISKNIYHFLVISSAKKSKKVQKHVIEFDTP